MSYTPCIKFPLKRFHEFDCRESLYVEFLTQSLINFVIAVNSCKCEYACHMFCRFCICWSETLTMSTPISKSILEIENNTMGQRIRRSWHVWSFGFWRRRWSDSRGQQARMGCRERMHRNLCTRETEVQQGQLP